MSVIFKLSLLRCVVLSTVNFRTISSVTVFLFFGTKICMLISHIRKSINFAPVWSHHSAEHLRMFADTEIQTAMSTAVSWCPSLLSSQFTELQHALKHVRYSFHVRNFFADSPCCDGLTTIRYSVPICCHTFHFLPAQFQSSKCFLHFRKHLSRV